MTVSELRFPAPGLKTYAEGAGWTLFGFALIAWGAVVVAWNPWNWAGAIFIIGGVFVGAVGVVFTLMVWVIVISGTIGAWRDWRQFRPPGVVVDASGVRYLAPRRPVLVSWAEAEQVGLHRKLFRGYTITTLFLRLSPDASLLREGTVRVSADRTLRIGRLSKLSVPESEAVRFLEEILGSPLEITEDDRRDPAYGRGGQ